jgi:beta-glucosidase
MKKFPDNFYFGASTSSHQVEGGCINDWSEWEKSRAEKLAEESVRFSNIPSWDRIKNEAGNINNYVSGTAADHYNRYNEDFDIASKIGINAYRFSIEWSRVEPERGVWNDAQLKHYIRMISSLRERDIEPFVTIWHWTLPVWLAEAGGVSSPEFPVLFAKYAAKLAETFAGSVKYYIIINEPEIYSLNSCFRGIWPPEKKGFLPYFRSMRSLIKSHIYAYDEIKKRSTEASIGTACNMTFFESGPGIINRLITALSEKYWNYYFLDRISPRMDFIGINYYFHNRINYGFNKNDNAALSDLGWELYPEGIEPVLISLLKYNLPVYITENGLADAEDKHRPGFIETTLKSVMKAMEKGVDVRGYFHWSLIDNFEWDKGFWPRFGLISIDRKDLARKIRTDSCAVYKKIIEQGLEL